jgi:ribosomal-protein-alanine N-acetyltransferase
MKPPAPIETERLVLRMPVPADAEAIDRNYARDPEVTHYLTWRPNTSVEQAKEFIAGSVTAWQGEKRFPYAITLKGEGQAIGMIELRLDGFKAELGYGIGRTWWGKGYMTEAVLALVDWSLAQAEIYRVWAVCDVDNVASARVMEKAGMQREGLLRRAVYHPNASPEPRDCYVYASVKE